MPGYTQGGPQYYKPQPQPPGGAQTSGPSYTADNQYKNDQGFQNRNSYGGTVGGADQAVNRYRSIGAEQANRGAYQANYDAYNNSSANANWDRNASGDARNQQQDALALQRAAATGQQPSQAEILGRSMANAALQNQVAAAGSARGGPMQQAAAYRGAADAAAGQGAQLTSSIQAGRAGEMAQARDAYQGAATGIRQGDFTSEGLAQGAMGLNLQQTGQDIQNQQFQRGLNQQGQQFNENLANNVNDVQLAANQAAQGEADQQGQASIQNAAGSSNFSFNKGMQLGGMILGGATGGAGVGLGLAGAGGGGGSGGTAGSDVAMKTGVHPLSSVMGAPSMTDPGGASAGELGMGGAGGLVKGTISHENNLVSGAIHNQVGGSMTGGAMTSDAAAKRDAHDVGYAKGYTAHAADQQAASAVDARRKAGGYAQLDMTPIPQGAADSAGLHGAIEQSTAGATPYAPAARDVGADNADEAAKIRAGFEPSMGDQAQTQWNAAHGAPAAAGSPNGAAIASGGLMGMSHSFLSNAMAQNRDAMRSDAAAKEAAREEGMRAGAREVWRAIERGDAPGYHYTPPQAAAAAPPEARRPVMQQTLERPGPAPPSAAQQGLTAGLSVASPMGASVVPPDSPRGFVPAGQARGEQLAPALVPVKKTEGAVLSSVRGRAADAAGSTGRAFDRTEDAIAGPSGLASHLYGDASIPEGGVNLADAPGSVTPPRTAETAGGKMTDKPRGKATSDERAKKVIEKEEPMADANRSMAPSEYRYKPEFTPPDQVPGEKNVGPMANNMERDPVAATAVLKDPSGLLSIDKTKALKLALGGLASLQHQVDALAAAHGRMRDR